MKCEISSSCKWIWAESLLSASNCYVYARREFELDGAASVTADVTCSSEYKLYVNGRFIGRGPGPCDIDRHYYDTYNISNALRPGKNVIAAICHNSGVETSAGTKSPGGFLVQLTIRRNGDEPEIVATDETWRVLPANDWDFSSAPICPGGGFQEVYDSRKKPVGWNVVGFDDSAWEQAYVIGEIGCKPWVNLVARQIPPLMEMTLRPQQVLAYGIVTPVDDCELDVAGRIYADGLTSDSSTVSYSKELIRESGDGARVNPGTDSFLTLDFGMEVVGYLSIRIRSAGASTVDIGYSEALDADGRVCPMRHGVMQADRVILHGGRQEWQSFGRRAFRYVQLTFRDVDVPIVIESVHVSRVGYPVDLISWFNCSDESLNEIWRVGVYTLKMCMQNTYEISPVDRPWADSDARVQALANYYTFFDAALAAKTIDDLSRSKKSDPSWVAMLHEYYSHTGDVGLVTELYPRVNALLGEYGDKIGYDTVRDAEKLAAAVSNSEDALRWHELGGRLRGSSGAPVPSCDAPRSGFDALRALAAEDRAQEALDLVRSKWGGMLRLGAMTFWESFSTNGTVPDGSLCCGASCAPTYFLSAEILGVKPSMPGGAVVIQPRTGGLTNAQGRVKTASGFVDVQWHVEPGRFVLEIEAPTGFITAIPVDGFTKPVVDEVDLTPETPERRARRTYGWGNTIWRDGGERDPYVDWLTTQEADPPTNYIPRDRCSGGGSYIWVRESVSTHVRYEVHEG